MVLKNNFKTYHKWLRLLFKKGRVSLTNVQERTPQMLINTLVVFVISDQIENELVSEMSIETRPIDAPQFVDRIVFQFAFSRT
jgi:hypothetical protein